MYTATPVFAHENPDWKWHGGTRLELTIPPRTVVYARAINGKLGEYLFQEVLIPAAEWHKDAPQRFTLTKVLKNLDPEGEYQMPDALDSA